MSVESEFERFASLNASIGKRALNALFPDDFEIYIFALELVNGNGETEDYFIFPINPNSVSEQNGPIQSFRKTAGGMTVLSTTTFSPSDITLQGNFGRKLKFLIGQEVVNFASISFKPTFTPLKPEFNKNIKTGYGCVKLLENLIQKSNTLDANGKPYALYLYNLALGNSYLIKVVNYNFHQNQEMNMIWNYNLTIKSLIRVEDIIDQSQQSLTTALSANSAIQNTVNNIASTAFYNTVNTIKTIGAMTPH